MAVRLGQEVAEDRFNLYYKYRFPQGKRDSFDREKMRRLKLLTKQIFDLANMERLLRGLPALSWNRDAALAALEHSREMYIHNYFDHFSPVTGRALIIGWIGAALILSWRLRILLADSLTVSRCTTG